MKNPDHRRRSIRVPEFGYTRPGDSRITICTHNNISLFGQINDSYPNRGAGIRLCKNLAAKLLRTYHSNEKEYETIEAYILNNPANWLSDNENIQK